MSYIRDDTKLAKDEFHSTVRAAVVDGTKVHLTMNADAPKYGEFVDFAAESVEGLVSVLVFELEFQYL